MSEQKIPYKINGIIYECTEEDIQSFTKVTHEYKRDLANHIIQEVLNKGLSICHVLLLGQCEMGRAYYEIYHGLRIPGNIYGPKHIVNTLTAINYINRFFTKAKNKLLNINALDLENIPCFRLYHTQTDSTDIDDVNDRYLRPKGAEIVDVRTVMTIENEYIDWEQTVVELHCRYMT